MYNIYIYIIIENAGSTGFKFCGRYRHPGPLCTHPGPLLQGGAQIRTTGIIEETCRYPPPEMLEEIKACTTIQVSHSHTGLLSSEIPKSQEKTT
jgi:hypothetical protein